MDIIKVLQSLGLEVENVDEMSDEDIEKLISEKVKHFHSLESEKESLSKEKEELTASVEGYKSREENLSKELSETKEKLIASEAKVSQITELYKEHFTKDPEEQDVKTETKDLENDVLQKIIDSK